ncbi:hypothetical protein ACFL35_12675 [Candidatus Riflebacteria bacterium]
MHKANTRLEKKNVKIPPRLISAKNDKTVKHLKGKELAKNGREVFGKLGGSVFS